MKGGSQQNPLASTSQNPKAGSDTAGFDQYLLKVEQLRVQSGLVLHPAQWEVRKARVDSRFLFLSDTPFLSLLCSY